MTESMDIHEARMREVKEALMPEESVRAIWETEFFIKRKIIGIHEYSFGTGKMAPDSILEEMYKEWESRLVKENRTGVQVFQFFTPLISEYNRIEFYFHTVASGRSGNTFRFKPSGNDEQWIAIKVGDDLYDIHYCWKEQSKNPVLHMIDSVTQSIERAINTVFK